jgi:hypothetical protein
MTENKTKGSDLRLMNLTFSSRFVIPVPMSPAANPMAANCTPLYKKVPVGANLQVGKISTAS